MDENTCQKVHRKVARMPTSKYAPELPHSDGRRRYECLRHTTHGKASYDMSAPELPHIGGRKACKLRHVSPDLPHLDGRQRRKSLQPARGKVCTNAYVTLRTVKLATTCPPPNRYTSDGRQRQEGLQATTCTPPSRHTRMDDSGVKACGLHAEWAARMPTTQYTHTHTGPTTKQINIYIYI